jgi:CRP-like cAMP-binding protein
MPEVVVRPSAQLRPRPGDEELTIQQVEQISLFKGLSRRPDLGKLPGTVILRHFRKGEVICRQGEPGWTAFYILKSEDLLELRESQAHGAPGEPQIAELKAHVEQLRSAGAASELRHAASAHLAIARPGEGGLFRRLTRALLPTPKKTVDKKPLFIPIDGPTDIDYDSLEGRIYEGEVFGEMSCLLHTPRSATVVAVRDCTMLETLRNVLDLMLANANKAFKTQMDETYKKRVLELHLRGLPLFGDLPMDVFQEVQPIIQARAELDAFGSGTLLCDENERSDSLFLIRGGFVKVMKNVTSLLNPAEIADWQALYAQLVAGAQEESGPRRKLWQLLPAPIQESCRLGIQHDLAAAARSELVHALNDILRTARLYDAAEFKEHVKASGLVAEGEKFPAKLARWNDHERARKVNRALLAAVCPAIPRQNRLAGSPRILSYRSRGDAIGEMGLFTGEPRNATCIAYEHPDKEKLGEVELVKIDAALFQDLLRATPALRERLDELVTQQAEENRRRLAQPLGDERRPLAHTDRFEELALIQGQRLMLIDLDRCTRCDECVRACVNSHDDHRTRLILDGPRIGKYLVPATCRMCKDPVCLIGCPVGSIHKGGNGQIVIEDWCVGCSRCAENCPYSSIQMHDVGLIPRAAQGWRYLPAAALAKESRWRHPSFPDDDWPAGPAPFQWSRIFKESLGVHSAAGGPLCFRLGFYIAKNLLASGQTYQLQVQSRDPSIGLWINDKAITLEKARPDGAAKRDKGCDWHLEAELGVATLRAGQNLIAASVTPSGSGKETFFDLGLYSAPDAEAPRGVEGEFTGEVVMRLAVVCDLCSTLPSRAPACVTVCPHEAAMRLDSRTSFPAQ